MIDQKDVKSEELPGKDDPAMSSMLQGFEAEKEEVKEPESKDKKADGKADDPSDKMDENHPRYKQIYAKMKDFERETITFKKENEDLKKNFEALTEHNKQLAESISSVKDQIPEAPRPDPTEDPAGYDKWIMNKLKSELAPAKTLAFQPTPAPQTPAQAQPVNQQLMMQEAAMGAAYSDYYDVAAQVAEKMKVDMVLRDKIMSSVNPAKALYDYHLEVNGEKNNNFARGSAEGGGYEPSTTSNKNKLTKEQATMARNLGLSEEQYQKQLAFMRK